MAALSITKPVVNLSSGTWGSILNQALDDIVTAVNAATLPTYANYAALPAGVTVGNRAFTTDTNTQWTYVTYSGTGVWVAAPGTHVLTAYQTATQNLTDSTWTTISFSAAGYTQSNAYSTWVVGSPTRFTPAWPGWYEFSGGVAYASAAAGNRFVGWRRTGATPHSPFSVASVYQSITTSLTLAARSWITYLATTDYVEMVGYQGSGSTVATVTTAGYQSHMGVTYLGASGLQ
jgi:hypothetical protein